MNFNIIQTFFIDKIASNGASTVLVTGVDLFFKSKPNATNNTSGINNPGVTIYLCETSDQNPKIENYYPNSVKRMEYMDITASTTASIGTRFKFNSPVVLETGKYYGIVIKYDDPGFNLWYSKQGDNLVGTNITSPGPSGKTDGYYFESTNSNVYNKRPDIDLKYRVTIAKFTSNNITATIVPYNYEFIDYDIKNDLKFQGGEYVFQDGNLSGNVTFYKTGTVSVNSQSNNIIGTGTSFETTVAGDPAYIILSDGTYGNSIVREVLYVTNNTFLTLKERPNFNNASGRYKISPIAKVYLARYTQNNIVLIDSNANSSVRFTNNSISGAFIDSGGEGYSNSDYLTVSGGGSSVNAVANVSTDTNGTILTLNFTNTGVGFTSNPSLTWTTSNGSITNTANVVVNTSMIGMFLIGEDSKAICNIANVTVHKVNQFMPDIQFDIPSNATLVVNNNFSMLLPNGSYMVNSSHSAVTDLDKVNKITKYEALIMSRSLEVINTDFLYNNDKSAVFHAKIDINQSNTNLFASPYLTARNLNIFTFWHDINNDATDEHTSFGNAVTKHITTKISFANNRFAEDIRVYLTAYKPANTDIKVYARIHNSHDPDAFDDKNWSELELKEGIGLISSKTNPNSYVELGYGFPSYPTTVNTISGTINTQFGNTTLTGVGTTFNTDLAENDLVKIYSPLFPETYQVAVVNSVTNATSLEIRSPIANNGLVGSGFKLDYLDPKNSAFNNNDNDNIVRYYNLDMAEYDTYDTFALKIVLLADNSEVVPRVDDVRAIGTSI